MILLVSALFLFADPVATVQSVDIRVRRSRAVIRVPRQEASPAAPTRWREERGPRCLPVEDLAGATVNRDNSIDLTVRDGQRIRAQLEGRCPAMDFYSGFYVRPGRDGMICADRDEVRSRSGGRCEIDRFRRLVPERGRRRR